MVTVDQRIEKREDIAHVIDGSLDRPDDAVTFSPGCCAGPEPGQFTISVPLETSEVRPDALASRGRAVSVTRRGPARRQELAAVLTFLNRLPAADEFADTDPMSVAVAIGTHSTAHSTARRRSASTDSTVAEMT